MTQHSAADKRKNLETIYPLAPLQEGILFHCLTAPDTGTYMPQIAFHLSGPIEADLLQTCWEKILLRHQALRAAIHWEERDEPFQVIYRHVPIAWETLDWSDTAPETHADQLQALYARNRNTPFDLHRPPLMRLHWIQLGAEQYILVLCYHHIILDGWSTSQMLAEAFALYTQASGTPTPALPSSRPYGDYIKWLKTRDHAQSSQYWQDYVAGTPGPSRVFATGEGTHDFARSECPFPPDLVEKLTGFLGSHGLTLSTVLHGVLGLQIARDVGRNDVFFGSATAGRPASLPGATAMVGLFINALPVRIRFDGTQRATDWLAALQQQQAATMEHEYVALRQIQKDYGTLFDCLLVIENYPTSIGASPQSDIQLTDIQFDEWTHFPLTLLVATGEANMKLILRHDRSVLPPEALARFVTGFTDLLEQMVQHPDSTITDLIGNVSAARPMALTGDHDAPYTAPISETEKLLATIWSEVLRRDPIGCQDNFFDIGGHSLMAIKVINRVRTALDLELPVRSLFERPKLADLATHIDALRATQAPTASDAEMAVEF